MQNQVSCIKKYLLGLQERLCHGLQALEPVARFNIDEWERDSIGGGKTCVIQNGTVIEKGGVNFSHVAGETLPPPATQSRPELVGAAFEALGVSSVIHPLNPFAPTAHMNVRYFEARKQSGEVVWWFGGGYDLTPYYGFEEDCRYFHETAKKACDKTHPDFYTQFKKNADDYFYLKHRQEARGIGGIFFDDLNSLSFEALFAFMQNVGDSFIDAYIPLLDKRKDHAYTTENQAFQHIRRGRYVEFNLVYDRGTLFGLQFGGRTESILMSLPKFVRWEYDYAPVEGSVEARLGVDFLQPRDWVGLA